ncbi:MAG: hypothetical protein BGP06_18125 [Rhizobiales bacterium 65-9]|nr:MAG: hypothetical protein BGP06_18125 [Rhizobiales bacterium 65-9]
MAKWLALAAIAGALGLSASAQAAPLAPAAEGVRDALPSLTEPAQARRAKRPRIVCSVRYRPFYNGLFWSQAPVRVCWRRY